VHDWWRAALVDWTLGAKAVAAQSTRSTTWKSAAEAMIAITFWGTAVSTESTYKVPVNYERFFEAVCREIGTGRANAIKTDHIPDQFWP